jgi:stage II sporulation protein AB (anti-sigma F factor)
MGPDATTATLRMALAARPENIAVVRQAIGGMAVELGADADLVDDIKTAVSEAVTNVVVHAYPDDGEGPVEVYADARGQRLEIVVRDQGIGMQPRPLSPTEPSLRVGLALIGALASGVEIRGEHDEGTEVRISFDLARSQGSSWASDTRLEPAHEGGTAVSVQGGTPGGVAITKVLELYAARSNLPLDRFSDAQLIGDMLAYQCARSTIDSEPLKISIGEMPGAIEIQVGPLEPGLGSEMLERIEIPGHGNTLERLADHAEVSERQTDEGPAEFLMLRLGVPDKG